MGTVDLIVGYPWAVVLIAVVVAFVVIEVWLAFRR